MAFPPSRLLRISEVQLVSLALRREFRVLLPHFLIGQVLAHSRVDLVQRCPADAAVAIDVHGGLHSATLAAGPHRESLHIHLFEGCDESTRRNKARLRLSEVLRVLPAELGEIGIAPDAILEVVLRLAMAREIDGLWLGVQIHHEGNDHCGKIAANVIRYVALAIVLIDLHDAIDGVFLLLEVVVTMTSLGSLVANLLI